MTNLKRTREDILTSVIETVHRKGFNSTGLTELFKVSGASSGSFYNYFSSKQELAHALIDFEWQKLKSGILDLAQLIETDPVAQVLWILDRLEEKQLQEPQCMGCLLGNLIIDLVENDTSFRHHLQQIFQDWEKAIAKPLHKLKAELKSEIDPDLLAEQILIIIEGTMLLSKLKQSEDYTRRGFDLARNLIRSIR